MRNQRVKESRYLMLISMLAVLRPDDLALIRIPPEVMGDIMSIRQDDDFYGRGAMAYGLLSTCAPDMTDMDRAVVSQTLSVASECVAIKRAMTYKTLSAQDVLRSRSMTSVIMSWVESKLSSQPKLLSAPAMAEEFERLCDYANIYDRDVYDKSWSIFWKSDTREGESK